MASVKEAAPAAGTESRLAANARRERAKCDKAADEGSKDITEDMERLTNVFNLFVPKTALPSLCTETLCTDGLNSTFTRIDW